MVRSLLDHLAQHVHARAVVHGAGPGVGGTYLAGSCGCPGRRDVVTDAVGGLLSQLCGHVVGRLAEACDGRQTVEARRLVVVPAAVRVIELA